MRYGQAPTWRQMRPMLRRAEAAESAFRQWSVFLLVLWVGWEGAGFSSVIVCCRVIVMVMCRAADAPRSWMHISLPNNAHAVWRAQPFTRCYVLFKERWPLYHHCLRHLCSKRLCKECKCVSPELQPAKQRVSLLCSLLDLSRDMFEELLEYKITLSNYMHV